MPRVGQRADGHSHRVTETRPGAATSPPPRWLFLTVTGRAGRATESCDSVSQETTRKWAGGIFCGPGSWSWSRCTASHVHPGPGASREGSNQNSTLSVSHQPTPPVLMLANREASIRCTARCPQREAESFWSTSDIAPFSHTSGMCSRAAIFRTPWASEALD